jgi:hypothetical protein
MTPDDAASEIKQRLHPAASISIADVVHVRFGYYWRGAFLWTACSYNDQRSYKETLMKNGKKRRAWTSIQVRELKLMARKKAPAAKIAKKLKRSEGATRQKAFSIGLSLDSRA